MIYNFSPTGAMFHKDVMVPKIVPGLLREVIHYGKAFDAEIYGQIAFIEGYYTMLKFPQEAENSMARRAQQMNYEYCVQTMAGLMKKYAPEILK